jgi:teichuronic acid biosynthesis glycosyltransferase TuaG
VSGDQRIRAKHDDLVSVVMPAHNACPFLEMALYSALGQSYASLEIFVVDDASSDATLETAEGIAATDSRVKVMRSNRKVGAAGARNLAIEASTGRYIAFLDSDDVWERNKLEHQILALRNSNAALSYTAYRKIDEANKVGAVVIDVPEAVTYEKLLRTNVILCSTVIYDTARIGKAFMPNIAKRQDYGLWLKILREYSRESRGQCEHPTAIGVREPLVRYRIRRNSVSSNKLHAARYQWRVYRQLEHLSWWRSLFYFLHYAFHGTVKHQRR